MCTQLFTLMKQHLDMYTYKVGTQQRRERLVTFDITIHNRYKNRKYLLGYLLMFQLFYFHIGNMII